MKVKFLILVFAGVVIAAALIAFNASSKNGQQRKLEPSKDRLRWHVAEAKKEGRQKVVLQTALSSYLGSVNTSLEQAFADYTVVVAKPIAKHTYQYDDNNLRTWYKFRIVDALTELKNPTCLGCFDLTPPSDMLPLDSNEFLVPRNGGEIVLDNVEIEQREPGFPEFQENQEYLLFISLYPNSLALTAGGPIGVFAISENETLTSFNKNIDVIQDGIRARFNSSLTLVRKRFKYL